MNKIIPWRMLYDVKFCLFFLKGFVEKPAKGAGRAFIAKMLNLDAL